MENMLENITIQQYADLLKAGTDKKRIEEINEVLNPLVQEITGGFDFHLFQLEKDLLLIQCKMLISVLEFDEAKQDRYSKRIDELKALIQKKTAGKGSKEEKNHYKSFIEWLLALKKYYGSDIDKNETLVYLVAATEQMMKSYRSQEKQIENQKAKK